VERTTALTSHLQLEEKKSRLEEVLRELENPDICSNPEEAQALGKEKTHLENICNTFAKASAILDDANELLEMAETEDDSDTVDSVVADLDDVETDIAALEFQRMFSGEMDQNSAFLDIQSGSGGTEAQDWAEMLLRMYLRWGEKHKYKVKLMEVSAGEVAGIKSATIHFEGDYAFGWLRSEIGIHRLVRKSPYNANGKRHTSFSSVFVSPEVDDNIEIEINPADLRIDTYRASGAGGR
jgi:peptide chain release factor 2